MHPQRFDAATGPITLTAPAVSALPQLQPRGCHCQSHQHSTKLVLVSQVCSHNHALAISEDSGKTWNRSVILPDVISAGCEGSIAATSDGQYLFVLAPSDPYGNRSNLTAWRAPASHPTMFTYDRQLYDGYAAYSSMVPALKRPDRFIVAFERGPWFNSEMQVRTNVAHIALLHFDVHDGLTQNKN